MTDTASPVAATGVAQDILQSIIERIERQEEEKAEVMSGIKDIYAEAKGNGLDPKIIRQIIRLRKKDRDERQEEEALLEMYMQAIHMA